MGRPFANPRNRPICILSVTLHNRMEETILVMPETFTSGKERSSSDQQEDEALVDLIASMHQDVCETLGFWVFISQPTGGVPEAHHFITPLQIVGHAVLQCDTPLSDQQILEAMEYDTKPDKDGNPPPLPKVRHVDKVTQVRISNPTTSMDLS
jgi:hypothetical protein